MFPRINLFLLFLASFFLIIIIVFLYIDRVINIYTQEGLGKVSVGMSYLVDKILRDLKQKTEILSQDLFVNVVCTTLGLSYHKIRLKKLEDELIAHNTKVPEVSYYLNFHELYKSKIYKVYNIKTGVDRIFITNLAFDVLMPIGEKPLNNEEFNKVIFKLKERKKDTIVFSSMFKLEDKYWIYIGKFVRSVKDGSPLGYIIYETSINVNAIEDLNNPSLGISYHIINYDPLSLKLTVVPELKLPSYIIGEVRNMKEETFKKIIAGSMYVIRRLNAPFNDFFILMKLVLVKRIGKVVNLILLLLIVLASIIYFLLHTYFSLFRRFEKELWVIRNDIEDFKEKIKREGLYSNISIQDLVKSINKLYIAMRSIITKYNLSPTEKNFIHIIENFFFEIFSDSVNFIAFKRDRDVFKKIEIVHQGTQHFFDVLNDMKFPSFFSTEDVIIIRHEALENYISWEQKNILESYFYLVIYAKTLFGEYLFLFLKETAFSNLDKKLLLAFIRYIRSMISEKLFTQINKESIWLRLKDHMVFLKSKNLKYDVYFLDFSKIKDNFRNIDEFERFIKSVNEDIEDIIPNSKIFRTAEFSEYVFIYNPTNVTENELRSVLKIRDTKLREQILLNKVNLEEFEIRIYKGLIK